MARFELSTALTVHDTWTPRMQILGPDVHLPNPTAGKRSKHTSGHPKSIMFARDDTFTTVSIHLST